MAVSRRAGAPVVFICWHGELLPLLWQHRDKGTAILVSEHRDGELIAKIAHNIGFRTVRGSTSRGAGRALLGLVRELEAGHEVAVTPDGPRGPLHSFAPGGLIAAHRGRAPVVLVRAIASSAWRLRSWDRFLIPKPFARVIVAYSDPTPVESGDARGAAAEAERFAEELTLLGELPIAR